MIKFVIKNLPTEKMSGPDGVTGEFYQVLVEKITQLSLKTFRKQKNSFPVSYEFNVALITKTQQKQLGKDWESACLMNANAKAPNNFKLYASYYI